MSEDEIRALIKKEVEKAKIEMLEGMVTLAEQLQKTITVVNKIVNQWNKKP